MRLVRHAWRLLGLRDRGGLGEGRGALRVELHCLLLLWEAKPTALSVAGALTACEVAQILRRSLRPCHIVLVQGADRAPAGRPVWTVIHVNVDRLRLQAAHVRVDSVSFAPLYRHAIQALILSVVLHTQRELLWRSLLLRATF